MHVTVVFCDKKVLEAGRGGLDLPDFFKSDIINSPVKTGFKVTCTCRAMPADRGPGPLLSPVKFQRTLPALIK